MNLSDGGCRVDRNVREVADRAIVVRSAAVVMGNPQSQRGEREYRDRSRCEDHLSPGFAAPRHGHLPYYRAVGT